MGYPLIHIAIGRDDNGKLLTAKGIVAIGQFAVGVLTIAQFGFGFLAGVGQFVFAPLVIAQVAVGVFFAIGQFSAALVSIGQFAMGYYVMAQVGYGKYVISEVVRDPEAIEFFKNLCYRLKLTCKFLNGGG